MPPSPLKWSEEVGTSPTGGQTRLWEDRKLSTHFVGKISIYPIIAHPGKNKIAAAIWKLFTLCIPLKGEVTAL